MRASHTQRINQEHMLPIPMAASPLPPGGNIAERAQCVKGTVIFAQPPDTAAETGPRYGA
jgi:hypothetical protein